MRKMSWNVGRVSTKLAGALLMVLVVDFMLTPTARAVIIETVPVGNLGNQSEWAGGSYGGFGTDAQVGAVDYAYHIGKYEVTAAQYTEFLNAVADVKDTYYLYDSRMAGGEGCKIVQSVTEGGYSYSVAAGYANLPVNYVSWSDAARFANWMHNGQPSGAQDDSTTEQGAYSLGGDEDASPLTGVTRSADALWFLPNEDEWYKAAYHKNNGDTAAYFDYPTSSDDQPRSNDADPLQENNANYGGSAISLTDVGLFKNSPSPYGTFDQGGNVMEWTETVFDSKVMHRGGNSAEGAIHMLAASRPGADWNPAFSSLGFRLATVPEPGSAMLLLLGAAALCCGRTGRRSRPG